MNDRNELIETFRNTKTIYSHLKPWVNWWIRDDNLKLLCRSLSSNNHWSTTPNDVNIIESLNNVLDRVTSSIICVEFISEFHLDPQLADYQSIRKVYIPANFKQVLWIGKSSSYDDKKNEQNEEEHLEETFESRWKGAVDEIVNNISASNYKEYLETFLQLTPQTIESASYSLIDQDNTQKSSEERMQMKRKRTSEEETRTIVNIDNRLATSFYYNEIDLKATINHIVVGFQCFWIFDK